jgi:hypothetical protein
MLEYVYMTVIAETAPVLKENPAADALNKNNSQTNPNERFRNGEFGWYGNAMVSRISFVAFFNCCKYGSNSVGTS